MALFQKEKKAMVFVDYEYWYYSYKTVYHIKPDPQNWRKNLEARFNIDDIMVFGDFSQNTGISEELVKLRMITNTIIETGNTFMSHKKDMTDFVMLDYIYQCAHERKDIDTYILFTGDGHFQSVAKYLTQKIGVTVIIYGIKDTFSKQLRSVASETHELPGDTELRNSYYRMIIQYLDYTAHKTDKLPTTSATIDTVAQKNDIPSQLVSAFLAKMIEKGYIFEETGKSRSGRKVKILIPNKKLIEKDNLWEY